MGQRTSLRHALASPAALAQMPLRSWLYLAVYLTLAATLLFVTAWQLTSHRGHIEELILDYVFPDSWQSAASQLLEYLFAQQHRAVVINAVVTTALMVVTVTLFPIKEKVSASFETGARLVEEPMSEHPLWEQGWQELKLFVTVAAVQGSIFLLGLLPHPGWRYSAVALGYLVVMAVFAVDFVAPLLQRHGGHYSRVLKTLLRRPLAALAFGAIFSAPTLLIGKLWEINSAWSWDRALFLLFGVNVLCIAWAVGSGTWLAARLYPVFTATRRSGAMTRSVASMAVLVLLAVNIYIYGALGLAVHHKSQILKCEYSVDFSSIDLDFPGLSGLLGGRVEGGISLNVEITNPTAFDVVLEDNEVVMSHRGETVATTRIAPLSVPAGDTVTQRVAFSMALDPSVVLQGRRLFDRKAWQIILYVDVAPYVRMPVQLVAR